MVTSLVSTAKPASLRDTSFATMKSTYFARRFADARATTSSFVFFTNVATTFHFSYERFLVNQLREHFGFVGTPIRIQVRRRKKSVPRGGAKG